MKLDNFDTLYSKTNNLNAKLFGYTAQRFHKKPSSGLRFFGVPLGIAAFCLETASMVSLIGECFFKSAANFFTCCTKKGKFADGAVSLAAGMIFIIITPPYLAISGVQNCFIAPFKIFFKKEAFANGKQREYESRAGTFRN